MLHFLLRTSIVFFIFFFINIGYYLYQLILGKFLGVSDFGVLSGFFALQFILMIPTSIVGNMLMRYVPIYSFDEKTLRTFVSSFFSRIHRPVGTVSLGGLLLSPWISEFLGFAHTYEIILILATTWVTIYVSFARSLLYAMGKIKIFAYNNIIEICFRIMVSFWLIRMGAAVEIVYSTYIIAMIGSWIWLYPYIRRYLSKDDVDTSTLDITDISSQILPMIVLASLLIVFGNIEIVIAKSIFESEDVALFSSLILMGKIILSGLGLFIMIANPYFAKTYMHRHYFYGFYVLFLLAALLGVLIYTYFPTYIISILFHEKYLPGAPFLGNMAGIMAMIAFLGLILTHGVIAGRRYFAYLGGIPLFFLTIMMLSVPPESIGEYIHSLFSIYALSVVLILGIIGIREGRYIFSRE